MSEQELEKRMEEIRQIGDSYASAKANLNYLEHYRKIRLAQMMKQKMSTCANMSVAKADLESRAEPNTPNTCLLYTSPSPRDGLLSRMPSSA